MKPRIWTALMAVALLALLPDLAYACPVCFDPREENRVAFLATTVFMSLIPLGMVGGLGMWLRKRARDLKGPAPDDPDRDSDPR